MTGFGDVASALGNVLTRNEDVANTAAGASGGSPSGPGSGGVNDREQYYRIYRAVCQVLGIPLDSKVAAIAYKNRQPGTGFLSLVKRYDKNYLKTNEFKSDAAAYVAKFTEMLPGRRVDLKDMARFVRGDWGNERVEQYIMSTKAFKKAYPYFRPGDHSAPMYRKYDLATDTIIQGAFGHNATETQKRMFFDYDMTPAELQAATEDFITGSKSLDMMFGSDQKTGDARVNDYILQGPGNIARRALLKQAVETQGGFNKSSSAGAALSRDESTRRITQTGI